MPINVINRFTAFSRAGFTGFARTEPVSVIVIHGTGAGQSTAEGFLGHIEHVPANHYSRGGGTFHYFITREGTTYRMLDDAKGCYHTGSSRYINGKSIGIELFNTRKNLGAYTDEQYNSLAALIVEIILPNHPEAKTIYGHWNYAWQDFPGETYKQSPGSVYMRNHTLPVASPKNALPECPGSTFNWSTLQTKIESYGYTVLNEPGTYYRILTITENPASDKETDPNPNNKYIATTGCTFKGTPNGPWTPNITNLVPTFVPSTKMLINGVAVAMDQITWTITGCILSGDTLLPPGGISTTPISSTTTKCDIEENGILREKDIGVCNGSFQNAGPCSCNIEIDDAGQIKVLCS